MRVTLIGLMVLGLAGPAMAGQLAPPLDPHPARPVPHFTTPPKGVQEWAARTIAVYVAPYIRTPCNYADFGHLAKSGDPAVDEKAAWLNQEAKLAAIKAGCTY